MSSQLPSDLAASLNALAEGVSRRDLARRAAAISDNYRAGGASTTIRSADDALAYAFTRMPATFAAVGAALEALAERRPDFAPRSLLDLGAGPGTAAWAAVAAFPGLASIRLIDANPHLRALALRLLADAAPALRAARYDAGAIDAPAEPADLVIASYVIGELPQTRLPALADALWARAADTLLVVEPGTPAGFTRIATLRAHLIGRGAHALAPCPHDGPCPIQAPDWCHFSRRLARSRDHLQVKDADVPFEDEKFAYVALGRTAVPGALARVLAPPHLSKPAIAVKLCTSAGIVNQTTPRRDRDAFKARAKWRWGDAVSE